MKKEDTKRYEDMSMEVFGHKYHYKKLMTQGLRYREGTYVRRRPLTAAGVWEYMRATLEKRNELLKEMEKQNEERG